MADAGGRIMCGLYILKKNVNGNMTAYNKVKEIR